MSAASQDIDQTGGPGQLPEQLGPGVGGNALAIRAHFHLPQPGATLLHSESAFPCGVLEL